MMHLNETAKHALDGLSLGSAAMAVLGIVPEIAALLGAVWIVMRLYESWLTIKIRRRELRDE